MKKAIELTNGYKTKGAALIYLLLTVFGDKIPFVANNKELAVNVVDVMIASGLLHDAWRNRKKIFLWVKGIVKKKA